MSEGRWAVVVHSVTEDALAGAHGAQQSGPHLGSVARRIRSRVMLWREGPRFARDLQRDRGVLDASDQVRIVDREPLRVLLVGGDYALGVGAADRLAALDGAIAGVLHEATGRGVSITNRARQHLRLADVADSLGATGAYTFDLVLWAPTFTEAARCITLRPWRSGAADLLRVVRATSDAGLVLLSVPQLLGSQPLAVIARWRAAQITRALSAAVVGADRAFVVQPSPVDMHELQTVSTEVVYRETAVAALPALLAALPPRRSAASTAAQRKPPAAVQP